MAAGRPIWPILEARYRSSGEDVLLSNSCKEAKMEVRGQRQNQGHHLQANTSPLSFVLSLMANGEQHHAFCIGASE